jgi:hypothetical protein
MKKMSSNSNYGKVSTLLALGANITNEWLSTVLQKAKKEWKITLEDLLAALRQVVQNRGIYFDKNMESFLQNNWNSK